MFRVMTRTEGLPYCGMETVCVEESLEEAYRVFTYVSCYETENCVVVDDKTRLIAWYNNSIGTKTFPIVSGNVEQEHIDVYYDYS